VRSVCAFLSVKITALVDLGAAAEHLRRDHVIAPLEQ